MASGDTLLIFNAHQNDPISTPNGATFDIRNQHLVLDFDDSTEEDAVFSGILPKNYSGGGLNLAIHWAMSSATSGDIRWKTAIERIGEAVQDLDSDGFAAAVNTGNLNVPGTSGHVEITGSQHASGAQMDNLNVGEAFRLKISRDATDAGDNATGDAELLAIEIKEL